MTKHNETLEALKRMSEEDPNGFSNDILALIDYKCKTAKAEAYKEFANTLCAEIDVEIKRYSNIVNDSIKRAQKQGCNTNPEYMAYCDGKLHALSDVSYYIDNILNGQYILMLEGVNGNN